MYTLKILGKISSFFDFLGGGLRDPPTLGNRDIESPGGIGLSLIKISEPTRLLSISYAVFCLKKKKKKKNKNKKKKKQKNNKKKKKQKKLKNQ